MEVQSHAHIFKNKIIVTNSKIQKCDAQSMKIKESNATARDALLAGVYVRYV
jgi:hypothetical protein